MGGEFGAIDDGPPADGAGTQTAGIDPPPYGVVGDAEQASGVRNPILRHSATITSADAEGSARNRYKRSGSRSSAAQSSCTPRTPPRRPPSASVPQPGSDDA